jgi:hypothetical protein
MMMVPPTSTYSRPKAAFGSNGKRRSVTEKRCSIGIDLPLSSRENDGGGEPFSLIGAYIRSHAGEASPPDRRKFIPFLILLTN